MHKGREEIVNIPRKAELHLPPDPNKKAEENNDASKYLTAAILPGGIGYLKIDAFVGNMEDLLPVAMDRLQHTRALVIDVRQNSGGDQSGSLVLARFLEQKVARYKVSPRNSDFILSQRPYYFADGIAGGQPFAPWSDVEVEPAAPGKAYLGKPVVVLTAAGCFSACDTFVGALKAHQLALVLGEATGGGTGSPLVFELPHTSLQFRYSVVRGLTPLGEAIEGRGTAPDRVVPQLPAERFAGKDTQLNAALALLAGKIGGEPPQDKSPVAFPEQSLEVSPTVAEDAMVKMLSRNVEY